MTDIAETAKVPARPAGVAPPAGAAANDASAATMPNMTNLQRFRVPLGGQEIELAEVVHDAGGMPLLRVRIREKSRFTIFDIDPVTARSWGEAMRDWGASRQPEAEPDGPG
jgi:hypothetical protein